MTSPPRCLRCGGDDILYNESRGETCCTQCGYILEENHIIDSLSFVETPSGAVKSVGQFVPTNGFAVACKTGDVIREMVLYKGYTHIQNISNRLDLPAALIEAAQRIYLISVQRGFTTGRVSQHVAAACLYISCRREKSPYMLIDFSDVLMTPVKTLGRTFVKMVNTLKIRVPTIDPSLFMERFVSKINELKPKACEIAHTGVRLVQAMTRDWISTGRRPTGLCGAALLVAARIHGFKINPEDISSVIRLASSTIRKRLSEFEKTSTAKLKMKDFESTDLLQLPIVTAPPCVMAAKAATLKNCFSDRAETYASARSYRPNALIAIAATTDEICAEMPTGKAISGLATQMIMAIENTECDFGEKLTAGAESPDSCSTQDTLTYNSLSDVISSVKENAAGLMDIAELNERLQQDLVGFQASFNQESETLSDVSDTEVDWMLLSEKEKEVKTLIWDDLMKNLFPQVYQRNCEASRRNAALASHDDKASHKRRTKLTSGCHTSPAKSVKSAFNSKSPAISRRLDDDALQSLFIWSSSTTCANSTSPYQHGYLSSELSENRPCQPV